VNELIEERKKQVELIDIQVSNGINVTMPGYCIIAHPNGDVKNYIKEMAVAVMEDPPRVTLAMNLEFNDDILAVISRLEPHDHQATASLFVATEDDSFAVIIPQVYFHESSSQLGIDFSAVEYAAISLSKFRTYRDGDYQEDLKKMLDVVAQIPERKWVYCDANCGAFRDPKTPEEIKKAYLHWSGHSVSGGCAHGC